jgi:hypothetical protein
MEVTVNQAFVANERGTEREATSAVQREGQVGNQERGACAFPDPEGAWNTLASECPVRIMSVLHEYGHYLHYHDPKNPGKVVCLRHDCEVPDHFHLTVAQERAYRHTAIAEKLRGEAETVVDNPSTK